MREGGKYVSFTLSAYISILYMYIRSESKDRQEGFLNQQYLRKESVTTHVC